MASLSSSGTILMEPQFAIPEHNSPPGNAAPTRVVSPDFLQTGGVQARLPPVQQSSMGSISRLSKARPKQHPIPQAPEHSIQKRRSPQGVSYRAVHCSRKGRPQRSAE